MKVLFLDIDGVLNSEAFMRLKHWRRQTGRTDVPELEHRYFCPIAVNNLRLILQEAPDVHIVITSALRKITSFAELQRMFAEAELQPSRLIGVTPNLGTMRGVEIQAWLDKNPAVTNFVILDDDSDMGYLMPHLVKTDFRVGLTLPLVDEVVGRFRRSTQ